MVIGTSQDSVPANIAYSLPERRSFGVNDQTCNKICQLAAPAGVKGRDTSLVSSLKNLSMEKTRMMKIVAALIAALFAAVTFSAVAADEARPADAKPAKSAKKHHKKVEHKKEVTAAPAKQ